MPGNCTLIGPEIKSYLFPRFHSLSFCHVERSREHAVRGRRRVDCIARLGNGCAPWESAHHISDYCFWIIKIESGKQEPMNIIRSTPGFMVSRFASPARTL